jgi:hypothetical protein
MHEQREAPSRRVHGFSRIVERPVSAMIREMCEFVLLRLLNKGLEQAAVSRVPAVIELGSACYE